MSLDKYLGIEPKDPCKDCGWEVMFGDDKVCMYRELFGSFKCML